MKVSGWLVVGLALVSLPAFADEACAPAGGPSVRVAAIDERTLTLVDGREAVLTGIETPADSGASFKAALASLIGRDIALRPVGAPDRWSRLPALVFEPGAAESLNAGLLKMGVARLRVAELAMLDPACRKLLQDAETQARGQSAGLWAQAKSGVFDAAKPDTLLQAVGTEVVVEGRVLNVGERSYRTYLNFGRKWSEDMTVSMPKRIWQALAKRGMTSETLRGRRVRVRGRVESRGGPLIELTSPEQIELIDTK